MSNRLKIEIVGNNPDYFLKELIKYKVNYYYLKKYSKKLILILSYADYQKLIDIKTTYEINILDRYGYNKIVYYLKKLKFLFIFLLLGIILNTILTNMIFEVEVIHPNKNIRNIVLKDLEEFGIKKYHFKVNYQKKEQIKKKLKEKEKLIDWIEIDEYGTKYIVRVEEKKINKNKKICNSRNIIANKNALILDIDASSGEVKKNVNEYVEAGEVIISGFIYNKDKAVSKKCATGTVYGETWYRIKTEIPKYKKKIKLLKDSSLGIELNILNKNKKTIKKYKTYKKYFYNVIDSDFIPIKYSFVRYRKTKNIYRKLNDKEIKKMAFKIATTELNKKLDNDEKVLKKKILKKIEKNSKIEVDVFVSVRENITGYQDITKINLEEMNKKEE